MIDIVTQNICIQITTHFYYKQHWICSWVWKISGSMLFSVLFRFYKKNIVQFHKNTYMCIINTQSTRLSIHKSPNKRLLRVGRGLKKKVSENICFLSFLQNRVWADLSLVVYFFCYLKKSLIQMIKYQNIILYWK